ncbi:MAG: DNA glycosylase [Lachnospiraceae bacterium]|nr:DNA glycosylase [Lachnospiraceae bacterium]
MDYTVKNRDICLKIDGDFIISQTLECGQCFNFNKLDEEDYVVTAFGRALHIYSRNRNIVFEDTTKEEFEKIWVDYFDLTRDYGKIKALLSKKDETLKKALEYAPGIRIINQDFFQCLISFIISQNNRIPMIKKVVSNLSKKYGEYIKTIEGEDYFSFPTPEKLYGVSGDELMECKTGFRGKYIADAVTKYVEGSLNHENFKNLTTKEVQALLMGIHGVGPKVADCVMLFSLNRSDAFPTDVWVKRIMSYFYFDQKDAPIKDIHSLADEKFGKYAGFAQQYLFNYARQFKIGTGKDA